LPIADRGKQVDRDDLKKRTMDFALRVVKLVVALPDTLVGRMVKGQLVRCGPAVAANYRAACKARSRAEFIAKIGTVEEEADESAFWMEFIIAAALLRPNLVQPLLGEASQLSAIFARSRITTASNLKGRKTKQGT
jgi:four helix bundle protein